jgi:hypothetical protein
VVAAWDDAETQMALNLMKAGGLTHDAGGLFRYNSL